MGTANTVYIGVDPGLSGGMAYITCEGIVSVQSMPLTEKDIWMWFQSLALVFPARENRLVGVIEKVTFQERVKVGRMDNQDLVCSNLGLATVDFVWQ